MLQSFLNYGPNLFVLYSYFERMGGDAAEQLGDPRSPP